MGIAAINQGLVVSRFEFEGGVEICECMSEVTGTAISIASVIVRGWMERVNLNGEISVLDCAFVVINFAISITPID